ncbi:MAG: hypothetical protein WAK53_16840 [Chromatiaceae bacterium]|jgi:hypothetical protein
MAYLVFAIAVPTDHFVTAFMPTSERLWLLLGIVPGTWAYRRTWHPLPGALGMGLLFAWAITVTFPVVR